MKRIVELGIYGILIFSLVTSLIVSLTSNYLVNFKFYIGLVLVLIALIFRFKSQKISDLILGATLILGTLNLIAFSHIEFGFSMTIFGLKAIGFNFIVFLLMIAFVSVNKELLQDLMSSPELTEEEKSAQKEQLILSYMKKHETKTVEELQKIMDSRDKFVEELVIAVERIIENKKNVL